MIVIDTSAVIALLSDEPERSAFSKIIEEAGTCVMSAASFVEASLVIESSRGYDGLRDFDLFIAVANIELIPVDVTQAQIARQAFHKYGKGRHPASLNFGDCFAYALAKSTGSPLLFKGSDFSQTDLTAAYP
jgi:ribonuclease VapC